MALTKEDLLAISDIMDTKLKSELRPLRDDIQAVMDDVRVIKEDLLKKIVAENSPKLQRTG